MSQESDPKDVPVSEPQQLSSDASGGQDASNSADHSQVAKKLRETSIETKQVVEDETKNGEDEAEERKSMDKKRGHQEVEEEPFSILSTKEKVESVEEPIRPISSPKKIFEGSASSKSPFGALSSASSPFASLTSNPSPFVPLAPTGERESTKKSTFGSSFSGRTFGSVASPKKKPRTEIQRQDEKNEAQLANATAQEDEEEDKEEANSNAFGNMLERKDDNDTADEQYVQVTTPLVAKDLFTGEEDETTLHMARAKLFIVRDGGWKERGTGQVRINSGKGEHAAARIVMRADAVLRVIMNSPLFYGMEVKYGAEGGGDGISNDKFVRMVILEDGKPQTVAFRFGNPNDAKAFRNKITELTPKKKPSPSPIPDPDEGVDIKHKGHGKSAVDLVASSEESEEKEIENSEKKEGQ